METHINQNPLESELKGPYLQTTLSLKKINSMAVPFQNGIPLPTFEPQEREILPLNGNWDKIRFQADHDITMSSRDLAWLNKIEELECKYLKEDSDDWKGHTIPLPENHLTGKEQANSAETYEDGVWYKRIFDVFKKEGKVYTLKALGISYVADVWLNGKWVGFHEGGFTPFALDLSPFLHDGKNEIRIRVDNPPWGSRTEVIPALASTDFLNYTGIIHDLYIEVSNCVLIARTDVVPLDTKGTLQVKVVVENRSNKKQAVRLDGEIYEANPNSPNFLSSPSAAEIIGDKASISGDILQYMDLTPLEVRAISYEVQVDKPKLWSIGKPNLYVAKLLLVDLEDSNITDRYYTQFGIRTLGTAKNQIMMNDSAVFLAGIARHEEWPEYGRTATWDRIRSDLQQIQQLNANMVRTGHYPNHVYTYLLLDRLGLAAMSEIPLWQFETVHYEAQEERKFADQMWREMVFSQYNRPSVIMWSTQNESKDVYLRLKYNTRLVEDLHKYYDDGRLITQSAAADQPGFDDPSMEPLDVAGWTMYFGVFHGSTYYEGTRLFLEKAHRAFPDKPILNTEYGNWTGELNLESDKQIETYQATLQALMEKSTVSSKGNLNQDGYVAGIDFWIMYNWYVNHNNWIDTFGIYHMNRSSKKPIACLIQADYQAFTSSNHGFALNVEPTEDVGLYIQDELSVTTQLTLDLKEPMNVTQFDYIQIVLISDQLIGGLDVDIKDESGGTWSYCSYDIVTQTWYPVYVPLYRAEGIELQAIKSIHIHSRNEIALSFKSIKATVAGTK
ncbi:glycoside hydrolase family 2 protein [Paenibacillus sp. YYML68]|uniref:glycoside hydrolase family 2 protein n=1 Tax=Paenibacillus sp. YYML68 TaxID=2909250 RepID=UPI002490614A|nr:glycoside hydrolase family 2 TIM barrel-domain containing protein [Paenibacillus sp. YYML68]